jgi:hypothetical protein
MRKLIALAAFLTVGCQSTLTGNEGNFRFSYWADDWVNDFNKPVAVHGFLDLEVSGVSSGTVDLTSAAFDDTAVLDVTAFGGGVLTITGVGDGLALLEVEGTLDGETLTDSVNMQSKVPEVLTLGHTCSATADAAYLTGHDVWVSYEMTMTNGQPVIGYGYYPVELTASTATLAADNDSQTVIWLNTGDTSEEATLASTLDSTTLSLRIGDESELDGVEEPIAYVIEDIDVGDTNGFSVRPMIGDRSVCQGSATLTVVSDTPETCSVAISDPSDEGSSELGWFEITGVAQGDCLFTVTYPNGSDGAGVAEQFSYPIEP